MAAAIDPFTKVDDNINIWQKEIPLHRCWSMRSAADRTQAGCHLL